LETVDDGEEWWGREVKILWSDKCNIRQCGCKRL